MWETMIRDSARSDKRSQGRLRSMGIIICMDCNGNEQDLLDEEEENETIVINE